MKIRKNGGFSLIEITVAIALIGILAGIGIPKLRKNLAIARDTKAIATLSTLRTASELYYAETGKTPFTTTPAISVVQALENLKDYLDPKTYNEIKNNKIEIGGSKTPANNNITYGGEIEFTFTNPNSDEISDGVYIWFNPDDKDLEDTKGKKWIEY